MSEIPSKDAMTKGTSREIEQLDAAVLDRAVVNRLANADLAWSGVRKKILDHSQLGQYIQQLDNGLWVEYMHQPVYLTGYVQEAEVHYGGILSTPLYDEEPVFVEDFPCESQGFTSVIDEDDYYGLRMLYATNGVNEEGEVYRRLFIAPLDSMPSFVDPVSTEHIHALLESYAPNLMAEVDERMLNTDGTSGSALASLKNLDLYEITSFAENHELFYQRLSHMLARYIHITSGLDADMPYIVDYSGNIVVDNGQGVGILEATDFIASLHSVIPVHYRDEMGVLQLAIGVSSTVRRDSEAHDESVIFFLDNLVDATSVRDYIYQ